MEMVLELPPFMKSMKAIKFFPTDQVLVEHYLYNKLHGLVYFRGTVFDHDLYGAAEPWQIWERFNGVDGRDLYFFTLLKRSTNKCGQLSSHVNRKVGSAGGSWSAENSLTPVFATDSNDQIIGYCRRLRYENPQMPEHHGEWIMHEYSLHESYIQHNCVCPNYVLCRIRKNERVKRKEENVTRSAMTPMENNERSNKRGKNMGSFVSRPVEQHFEHAQPPFECAPEQSFESAQQHSFECPPHQSFECAPQHYFGCAPHQAFECAPQQPFECAQQQLFECAQQQPFECAQQQPFECATQHYFECAQQQPFEYAQQQSFESAPHQFFECAPQKSFKCAPHQAFECAPQQPFECAQQQPFECATQHYFKCAQQPFECAPWQSFKSAQQQSFESAPHQFFECAPQQSFECAPHRAFECAPQQPFECAPQQQPFECAQLPWEHGVTTPSCEPDMTTNLDEVWKDSEQSDMPNLDEATWKDLDQGLMPSLDEIWKDMPNLPEILKDLEYLDFGTSD